MGFDHYVVSGSKASRLNILLTSLSGPLATYLLVTIVFLADFRRYASTACCKSFVHVNEATILPFE